MTDHPTLPRLHVELLPELPEEVTKRGRVVQPHRPTSVRALFAPGVPLVTSDPARLRREARRLLDAADALAAYQRGSTTDQPNLFGDET